MAVQKSKKTKSKKYKKLKNKKIKLLPIFYNEKCKLLHIKHHLTKNHFYKNEELLL